MFNVGLSAADAKKYYADLAVSHEVRLSVRILNLSHVPVRGNVARLLLEGQIDGQLIDVNRRETSFADFDDPMVMHTLTMRLLDPGFTLGFESGTPGDAALYLDRMVEVVRHDFSPSLGRWVACPMFLGPVTNLERNNDVVTIAAQSKEALASNPANIAQTYGTSPVTAIIRVMLGRTGEVARYMRIPSLPRRAAKGVALIRESRPFAKAHYLARGMGYELFYDGAGYAKFSGGTTPVFTFDGSNVLEFPSRSYGTGTACNVVRVVVGGGSGERPKFDVTLKLPPSHPNSASRLGRNGTPRWNLVTINDDNIASYAAAVARARAELRARESTSAGARFTALCVPGLELGDYVYVRLEGKLAKERVTAFSKPLLVDGVMSVGQTRLVSRPRRVA